MANILLQYSLIGYALLSCLWVAGTRYCMGLAVLAMIILLMQRKVHFHQIDRRLLLAIATFLSIMLLSAITSPQVFGSLKTVWSHMDGMLLFFLLVLVPFSEKQGKLLRTGLLVSVTIGDLILIWQGLHGNYRATIPGLHPMVFAGYLVIMAGVIAASFSRWKEEPIFYRCGLSMTTILSLLALFFNGTRGAWLAIAAVLIIFSFYKVANKRKWALALFVICLIVNLVFELVPFFHERVMTLTDLSYQSNSERLLVWQSAWQMFLDHPLLGIGPGNFLQEYTFHYMSPLAKEGGLGHGHNNFLQMLAVSGILGFLSFLYLFYSIILCACRQYQKTKSPQAMALLLATAGLLLQGFTEYNFGDITVIRLYWFVAGLAFAARNG